jgi:hypothetical protein
MKHVILFCIAIFTFNLSATAELSKQDSLVRNLSDSINELNMKFYEANQKLTVIQNNTVPDSFFKEIAKNYVYSFIYEVFGYKKSNTSTTSKLISIISFIFLLVRIAFFIWGKGKYKPVKFIVNLYLGILISIIILVPWTSNIFPNQNLNRSSIERFSKDLELLNKQITLLESIDLKRIEIELNKIKNFKSDSTLNLSNTLLSIEKNVSEYKSSLKEYYSRVDNITQYLDEIKDVKPASKFSQGFQTLLLLINLGLLILIGFFLKKEFIKN